MRELHEESLATAITLAHSVSLVLMFLFQAHLKFPPDYPYNPPSVRFLSKVWHPNVYEVQICLEATDATFKLIFIFRMETCAYPSSTPQWMTPSLVSCPVRGGTQPRT